MNRLGVLLVPALLVTAACNVAEQRSLTERTAGFVPPADAGVRDLGRPDVGTPDSGVEDLGPRDTGVSTSVRQMQLHRLFGDMRIDNRVFNPFFDLTANGILPLSADGQNLASARRQWRPETPVSGPVLRVRDAQGTATLLLARSTARALDVRIWVGRELGSNAPSPTVALLALAESGQDEAFELSSDGRPVEMDGLIWQRYGLLAAPAPLGWMQIAIIDDSSEPIYLAGAHAVDFVERPTGEWPPMSGRSLGASERAALRTWVRRMREQFTDPAPRGGSSRRLHVGPFRSPAASR